MEGKSRWQSKTVWATIVFVIISGIEAISAAMGTPIVVPDWIKQILIGFGIYGIRDGIGKPLQ